MSARDLVARERIAAIDRVLHAEVNRLDEVMQQLRETTAAKFVDGNEFRQSLGDQQKQMVQADVFAAFQTEYRNAHAALVSVVAELRTNIAVGPAELVRLAQRDASRSGREQGVDKTVALLLSVAAVVVAVVAAATAVVIATH